MLCDIAKAVSIHPIRSASAERVSQMVVKPEETCPSSLWWPCRQQLVLAATKAGPALGRTRSCTVLCRQAAREVLLAGDGLYQQEIAAALGGTADSVWSWGIANRNFTTFAAPSDQGGPLDEALPSSEPGDSLCFEVCHTQTVFLTAVPCIWSSHRQRLSGQYLSLNNGHKHSIEEPLLLRCIETSAPRIRSCSTGLELCCSSMT